MITDNKYGIIKENIITFKGVLTKGQRVKIDEILNGKIRIIDDVGKIWYIISEQIDMETKK